MKQQVSIMVKLPVTWEMCGYVDVPTPDGKIETAIMVFDETDIPLPSNPVCVEDSFVLTTRVVEDIKVMTEDFSPLPVAICPEKKEAYIMPTINPNAAHHPCTHCLHGGVWNKMRKPAGNTCKHPDITSQKEYAQGLIFFSEQPHQKCPLGGVPESLFQHAKRLVAKHDDRLGPGEKHFVMLLALRTGDIQQVKDLAEELAVEGYESQHGEVSPTLERTVQEVIQKHQKALERAFCLRNVPMYLIYQLKDEERLRYHRFTPMAILEKEGLTVDRSNYELIYTAPLDTGSTLNDIYQRLNMDHPADYGGHSLSISDVIMIRRDGQLSVYYVDEGCEFREIPLKEWLFPSH